VPRFGESAEERAVSSWLLEASSVPSALNATLMTESVWPDSAEPWG
jgi:hypothetical protein